MKISLSISSTRKGQDLLSMCLTRPLAREGRSSPWTHRNLAEYSWTDPLRIFLSRPRKLENNFLEAYSRGRFVSSMTKAQVCLQVMGLMKGDVFASSCVSIQQMLSWRGFIPI